MLQTFFAELKRRKVLRVVGAYAVVSWGVLQVADRLFSALMLPQWTVTFVAVLLLIGLPITAIITWAFEHTPEGISRTAAASEDTPLPPPNWIELALLLALLAAVAVSLVQMYWSPEASPALTAAPTNTAASVTSAENTIAVLPFTSFSDNPDSNYFADGLTEELINELASIEDLKVSGRTSSFYFKDRNEDLRDIGKKLGVAYVLEGSVRRSGDQLRITVQLVSTADGFHLWSQTYDRTLHEIFAIQDDVAANVASTLAIKLTPDRRLTPAATRDTENYRLYLVATALLHERALEPLTRARQLFAQLRAREPDNVEVLAGFAQSTMLLAGTFLALDFDAAATEATAALERALALNPDSVSANIAAGAVYTVIYHRTDDARQRDRAVNALERAVELAPEDPGVLAAYGTLLNEVADYEGAYQALRQAVDRDPLSRLAQAQLIIALEGLGRFAEAREKLLTLMKMYPDYLFAPSELGELLVMQGQLDAALPYLRQAHAARSSPRSTFMLANTYLNLGMESELRRTLAELDYAPGAMPFADAILAGMRGDDTASLQLAQTQLAKTNDPIWRSLLINAALSLGELTLARREINAIEPTLLTSLDATRAQPEAVLSAGELLLREGYREQATRLLEGLLEIHAPPAQGYDAAARKIIRAKILACLDRPDEAIAELTAAQQQGYRLLWDFDYFQRLDRMPAFVSLRDDPRFLEIIRAIEADNRAMRR